MKFFETKFVTYMYIAFGIPKAKLFSLEHFIKHKPLLLISSEKLSSPK